MTVDLALGGGMTFARRVRLALCRAPGIAWGALAGARRLQFALGGCRRLALGRRVDARLLQLVFDVDQPRALGEPARGAGRGVGRGDEAVPAPDVAFERDQPLAGLELRYQLRATF